MDQTTFMIPAYDDLDPASIEAFLDVDTDEFLVLFHGRDREHYVHPVNTVLSYLLDIETDEVVGVSFSRFVRQVLREHPYMQADIPLATILIGDTSGTLLELGPRPASTSWWGRLRHAIKAGKHAWDAERDQDSMRSLIDALPRIA